MDLRKIVNLRQIYKDANRYPYYIFEQRYKGVFEKSKKAEELIKKVCETFNVPVYKVKRKSKNRYIADTRALVAYVLRENDFRPSKIALYINCDRSNVFHMLDKVRILRENDKAFIKKYEAIMCYI